MSSNPAADPVAVKPETLRPSPSRILLVTLALVIGSTLWVAARAPSGDVSLWPWAIAQCVIVTLSVWLLHGSLRQARRLALLEARRSRRLLERLSLATNTAGICCWEYDFVQQKVTWLDLGPGSSELTEEQMQIAGRSLLEQFLPEDLRAAVKARNAATRCGAPTCTVRGRLRHADGSLHDVQMHMRFFYDMNGRRLRVLGANLDVTDSQRRQRELEALSIRFEVATSAARAGVWEWQESDQRLWWNDTMYAIYGCDPDAFQPDMAAVTGMIHSDDRPLAEAAWDEALHQTGQLNAQCRIQRPDGLIAHVEHHARVVTDESTGQRRMVGITLDIGAQMAAEQRERQLQRRLREASHRSGMAEVATGVLHNVGNVLNSLGVAAATARSRLRASPVQRVARVGTLLEEHQAHLAAFLSEDSRGERMPEYLRALGAQLEKDVADAQHEIETLGGHLDYLREIVRAQQGFASADDTEESVDIAELIDTALALQGRELRGIEIVRESATLPEVRTQRYRLLQIVVNFIGNARDAVSTAPAGSRCITLRAALCDEAQLEISVQDTGVGIAPQLLGRVWEFGFTTKAHGHGFGLHSAAVSAQALGGSVSAYSAGQGRGARFSVRIPFRPAGALQMFAAG